MQTQDLKVNAIAVRAVPYGESDMIVTLVGVDTGRVTATARGCLKRGAKLRYAAEPFNFGDYVLAGRNGRYIITECSQIDSFSGITADIDAYYAGCLILEALSKLSGEPSPETFMCALRALKALAYDNADANCALRDFLLGAICSEGNSLDFANCNSCRCKLTDAAYFSDSDGIVCQSCATTGVIPIDGDVRAFLAGEREDIPKVIKLRANILLLELVHNMIGIHISADYLTEQL